jgi:bacterioferritin-associated ferredoxin
METICYCFGYTDADILQDAIDNKGESSIERKIALAKQKGRCQCEVKNPKGQ